MLHGKSNKIFSEVNSYFSTSEKAIHQVVHLFNVLRLAKLPLSMHQPNQTRYDKRELLLMMLLFPLFSVHNISGYYQSALHKYLSAGKDTFYQFKNNSYVSWRELLYSLTGRLLRKVERGTENSVSHLRCLIIDDTEFPKTGHRIEHIGKVWSHVQHKCILGFKGLFLGYWDGKSFFGLDFSLHKERGKNNKRPYGMKPKQLSRQFKKQRTWLSHGYSREQELHLNKIQNAIMMIHRAINHRIKVDYILMDSWFVCEQMLGFIKNLRRNIHLVGMAKMGSTKYTIEDKTLSANQIAQLLKNKKRVKRNRATGLYFAGTDADYKGINLRLYFCKTSKRGKWHLLITTNKSLSLAEAYRIYSIRWSIEVFFKESKQYFKMGKSQSHDFDAQIADITIATMQYNIFSLAKRFAAYETLGQLFRDTKTNVVELTIAQRLWQFILELIEVISDILDIDYNELIVNILKSDLKNNKFIKLLQNQPLYAA